MLPQTRFQASGSPGTVFEVPGWPGWAELAGLAGLVWAGLAEPSEPIFKISPYFLKIFKNV